MGTAYPHLAGVTTGRKEQAAAEHAQRRVWYRGERMRAAIIVRRRRRKMSNAEAGSGRLSGNTSGLQPNDKGHLISERGRALILASAILDNQKFDPDEDISVLARQLNRAQEEIDKLQRDLKHLRIISP